ncbi:Fork head domain transcription factor slp2 like [Actinidia chinensis var. chinensis]|uniref:Uncharacterized protein n=2 Tax=Actinidia TaxID=3624 RepID=A0A7J0GQ93_9ERIC|nr:Fork head domain transcription factor slp2 like [Actinidia chinensis var. chinensis]GFZ12918.1 hypothetical protein Acr_23g0013030 [Actinidia rufa]
MKKSGILAAASVAAASATAISSSASASSNSKSHRSREDGVSNKSSDNSGGSSDKFAPRFDGLRFIETLVTAHR